MSHTPGPWKVRGPAPGGLPYLQVVAPEYQALTDADHVVCELRLWRQPRPEANARLIAAAPELLDALASIRSSLMELDDDGCGRPGCGWREMDATYVDQLISNNLRLAIDAIAKAEGRE